MIRELVENAIGLVRQRELTAVEEEAHRKVEERLLDLLLPSTDQRGRRWRRKPLGGTLPTFARADAGDARGRRTGAAHGRTDRRAEGDAGRVQRNGHGTHGHGSAGDVREDPAQTHGSPRSDRGSRPVECCSSRPANRCWIRRRFTRRRSNWRKTPGSSSSTNWTRSSPVIRKAADVSRQGVQRDLLPIVEGTTVQTRYGYVRTDHILFIAAGRIPSQPAQ